MIVATAGHVDHGKTTLVRALTGVDTDRLDEERRRGMTIDLGFAHADLGDDTPASFVDVPGHERFVRNMVAGAASVDVALVVVAVDDGPMPQTLEHLAILEWLGVPRVVVALTKIDRVPAARVAAIDADVGALLARGRFAGAPRFALNAASGLGLDALREGLRATAAALPRRAADGPFRFAVDRAFSRAGAGLVVTGTVLAGTARVGDTLIASPHGQPVRVRAIERQGRPSDGASAGMRCALNLAGAEPKRGALGRGDWIVAAPLHAPTARFDARLHLDPNAARPLATDATVQLHLAAATVPARVAVLDGHAIEPGRDALVQIVTERPVAALHGDRFVVRDPAAKLTLGGGRVIDPFGATRDRAKAERREVLRRLEPDDDAAVLAALLDAAPDGVDLGRFVLARGLGAHQAAHMLTRLGPVVVDADRGVVIAGAVSGAQVRATGLTAVAPRHWNDLRTALVDLLDAHHVQAPDRVGVTEIELVRRVRSGDHASSAGRHGDDPRHVDEPGPGTARRDAQTPARTPRGAAARAGSIDPLRRAALRSLLDDGAVVRDGFVLRRPAHVPRLSDAGRARLDRLLAALGCAGPRPPSTGDLAAALGEDLSVLRDELGAWARHGHLVQVAENRHAPPGHVADWVAVAVALDAEAGGAGFDAGAYRDRSGLGRNLTIDVLEFLDRHGVTRFRDGRRRLAMPTP